MAFMTEHLVLSSDEDKSTLDTRDSLEKLLVTGSVMLVVGINAITISRHFASFKNAQIDS